MDYSYIRDSFNIANSNNYILSLQLSSDGFSFYISEQDSIDRPLYFFSKRLDSPGGIQSLISELSDFQQFDNIKFHKSYIIFHTKEFCLIPDELHSPENEAGFMNLSHPIDKQNKVYTSDIPSINAKIVFNVPDDLNKLIESKFSDFSLLHSIYASVNYGIKKSEKVCVINHYGNSISITVCEDKNLKFFNVFSIHDHNDLIYFTLTTLKNCKIKLTEVTLYFSGVKNKDSEEFLTLSRFINNSVYFLPELRDTEGLDFPTGLLFNHLDNYNENN